MRLARTLRRRRRRSSAQRALRPEPYGRAASRALTRRARRQVRELLAEEPDNAEYVDLQTSLLEVRPSRGGGALERRSRGLASRAALTRARAAAQVVALTEDLLRSATEASGGGGAGGGGGGGAYAPAPSAAPAFAPAAGFAPPGAAPPGLLRTNWAPGEACQALFSDGQWHPATVQSAAPGGGFRVLFDHYAVPVPLPAASLRAPQRAAADEARGSRAARGSARQATSARQLTRHPPLPQVYVGVPAPKRLKVDERVVGREAPRKLEIQEGDDERTRERKKKLLKAFKSKQRLAEAEAEQSARAASWQNFRQGKAATKHKAGFLTNTKKESMFAVPEGGKVGVIGSGKGVTPAPERRKNEFQAP